MLLGNTKWTPCFLFCFGFLLWVYKGGEIWEKLEEGKNTIKTYDMKYY